jgi:CHAD domain-containing protein
MKQTVEREVKLEPGEGFVLPDLGGEVQPTRVFSSTYHDTADLVLARNGVTLRHRSEGGTGLWQLKLPGRDDARVELELAGPPVRPPFELVSLLVGFLRGRDLRPVARLRTRRNVVRTADAEIVDDTVAVMRGQRVVRRFREVEVELVDDADVRTLGRLEKKLRRAGASSGAGRPKLFQALDLEGPSAPRIVPPGASPSAALGIALGEQARRLLAHDPGTRLGSDPEELHQMRVATRRLRAFLRVGGKSLQREWSSFLRDELAWLGRALGPARDLDVLLEYLGAEIESLGVDADAGESLIAGLEAERGVARRDVVEALSSDRYLALLDRLDGVSTPELTGDETPLTDRWRAEWKRARASLSALDKRSPDEQLHEARIELKRARYAAELAAHELAADGVRFAKTATKLQDVLGAHQDAFVAEERIRAWLGDASDDAADAAARLIARQRRRRRAARAALPEALKAVRRAAKPIA